MKHLVAIFGDDEHTSFRIAITVVMVTGVVLGIWTLVATCIS